MIIQAPSPRSVSRSWSTSSIRCEVGSAGWPAAGGTPARKGRRAVAATDLINARLVIFESGPLISPILASSSVPVVFTPTRIEGRWFADGGLIDNFPVGPLKGLCDVLLGIYVSPLRAVRPDDLSSTLAVSQRALEVARYTNSRPKFHECDVLLCPDGLGDFAAFDTKHVHEIFDVGYRAAVARMDAIEAALASVVG